MKQNRAGIPLSVSLQPTLKAENIQAKTSNNKKRLLYISFLAVVIATAISFIAKLLVYLIGFITNISFYGSFSVAENNPAQNTLGWWVVVIPAAGGLLIGLMAFYGSKAIRGHGIPEAMEQILTNQSRIKPTITYLKPLSAAISIGTGGPFGAEGPIIATGGALGSMLGQLLHITHNERKVLLAAGATAGMSAIFGSPVAAIFLAIELLLFEFSPRSIIPVALACITGAAGHHLLFGQMPVFYTGTVTESVSNHALLMYSLVGIAIGLLSVVITFLVYWVEDAFEKLPVHWMWWPAIGGLAVGFIGYFRPETLGVGYNNITNILSGSLPLHFVISLCVLKFLSWVIALGSGTSGGTLAPLLTIGGALGVLAGWLIQHLVPSAGVSIPMAALVGMAAMFAGASRAFITSILFALETTGQHNAILPLLAACSAAYFVSFFLMENTIMTEKIARRGIKTPDSYEPDILEKISVAEVMEEGGLILDVDNTIGDINEWLLQEPAYRSAFYILSSSDGEYLGMLSAAQLTNTLFPPSTELHELINEEPVAVPASASLREAVEVMATNNTDVVAVINNSNKIAGMVNYRNVLRGYRLKSEDEEKGRPSISLKRRGLKLLVRGKKLKSMFEAND